MAISNSKLARACPIAAITPIVHLAKRPQKATYKPLVEQIEATGPHTDCNKTNHIFSTDSNVALHPKHAPGHEESAKLHFAGPEKGAAKDKTI